MKRFLQTRRRIQFTLAGAALVFIAIGSGTYYGVNRTLEDARWVAHTQEVISVINQTNVELLSAMAAARAYMISGNTDQYKTYLLSASSLPYHLSHLEELVDDNPVQVKNVGKLQELIDNRMAQLTSTLEGYASGGIQGAQHAVLPQSTVTQKALSDHINLMIKHEQQLLNARIQATTKSANILFFSAAAGIPTGLAMVLLVYLLLNRELLRRAQAEQEAVSAVSDLKATSEDLNSLGEFAGFLQSCETIEESLEMTRTLFTKLIPDASAEVYLTKASKNYLELKVHWGHGDEIASPIVYPGECWCLRRGKDHFSKGTTQTPNCKHINTPLVDKQAVLCMALSAPGEQLGIVVLKDIDEKLQARHSILGAAVEQLSLSLSGLKLRDTLRFHSTRDELTGLYNRRYLTEAFEQLHARSLRHDKPYAILMLDIDHFKHFNDVYGHAGGDMVLAEVGRLLSGLRGEDIACRYGGEELIVALPETDADSALLVADRIRSQVQQIRIDLNGKTLPPVTVSIGVSAFPLDGRENDKIKLNADLALYRAKREGRNRVVRFDHAIDSRQLGLPQTEETTTKMLSGPQLDS